MSDPVDPDPALERAQQRAFAELTEVGRATEAGEPARAVAAADRLRAHIAARPDDDALPGFGAMLLDAALWLVACGAAESALTCCEALVARLGGGSDAARAVAAGARFLAAQATAGLGDAARARAQLEALSGMGEPALAGLERMAGRLAASGADAAWHAQVAAATVTVLWRLERIAQARALAVEAAASFARLGRPDLEARLTALAGELG